MVLIKQVETGFYRIPLSVTLTDSTHGEMKVFELITVRVRDSDGAEGVGYTYTVGRIRKRSGTTSGGHFTMGDVAALQSWHSQR
jgi:L-alanine-DL-glutamate epimerase-like enolase superfamily enzyme